MNNREAIGLKSLSGIEILEGSTVAVYAQHHEVMEVVNDGSDGTAPVIVCDSSKPMPVLDVPLAHAHVYWCTHGLAWCGRLVWKCREWEESGLGTASIRMGGGDYAFEIIDQ